MINVTLEFQYIAGLNISLYSCSLKDYQRSWDIDVGSIANLSFLLYLIAKNIVDDNIQAYIFKT